MVMQTVTHSASSTASRMHGSLMRTLENLCTAGYAAAATQERARLCTMYTSMLCRALECVMEA